MRQAGEKVQSGLERRTEANRERCRNQTALDLSYSTNIHSLINCPTGLCMYLYGHFSDFYEYCQKWRELIKDVCQYYTILHLIVLIIGKEGEREGGGREGERERERGREGGRERGKEGEREGGKERGRERERERERERGSPLESNGESKLLEKVAVVLPRRPHSYLHLRHLQQIPLKPSVREGETERKFIVYNSRKPSQVKTFANFAVLPPLVNMLIHCVCNVSFCVCTWGKASTQLLCNNL